MPWTDLGPADAFAEGITPVEAGGRRLIVVREGERLSVALNECPHAGKPLDDAEVRDGRITCPFHAYCFDLKSGRNVDFTDEPPLRVYPCRVDDGRLNTDLPSPRPDADPA